MSHMKENPGRLENIRKSILEALREELKRFKVDPEPYLSIEWNNDKHRWEFVNDIVNFPGRSGKLVVVLRIYTRDLGETSISQVVLKSFDQRYDDIDLLHSPNYEGYFAELFLKYHDNLLYKDFMLYRRNNHGIYEVVSSGLTSLVCEFFKELESYLTLLIRYQGDSRHPLSLALPQDVILGAEKILKPINNFLSRRRIERFIIDRVSYLSFANDEHMFVFQNGIFDVETQTLRDASQDEYAICTHRYPFEMKNQEECISILNEIKKCFLDESQMEFYLKHLSFSLSNKKELKPILVCKRLFNFEKIEIAILGTHANRRQMVSDDVITITRLKNLYNMRTPCVIFAPWLNLNRLDAWLNTRLYCVNLQQPFQMELTDHVKCVWMNILLTYISKPYVVPSSVLATSREYHTSEIGLEKWLDVRLQRSYKRGDNILKRDLHTMYNDEHPNRQLTAKRFSNALKAVQYEDKNAKGYNLVKSDRGWTETVREDGTKETGYSVLCVRLRKRKKV